MPDDRSPGGPDQNDPDFNPPLPQAYQGGNPATSEETCLAALAERLIQRASSDEMARLVLEQARHLTASPHGFAGYLDPGTERLVCPAMTCGMGPDCGLAANQPPAFTGRRGLLGWVRAQGQPLLSNSPASDPRAAGSPEGHLAIRRVLSVPALSRGRLLGQVTVANAERDYSEGDQRALERLAGIFALALERALAEQEAARAQQSLEEEVRARTAHLEEANRRLQEEMAERRRAEQEIERFFLAAPDLMAVMGLDGYVKRPNPAYENLLGYNNEELLGTPFIQWVHPDDQAKLAENLTLLTEVKRVSEVELRVRRKDGTYLWTSWSAMLAPEPTLFFAVGRDISRRREYERALKESEALFRQMFENNRSISLVVDPESGAIVQANRAARDFYGYGLDELNRLNIADLNLLSPEQLRLELIQAAGGEKGYSVFSHRLADGRIRQVEIYSGPIMLHGRKLLYSIIHDATDRLLAEQALRDSEERYRDLVEGTDDLVAQVDNEGRFIFVNHMAREVLGLEPEQCLGRSALDFVHPGDRQKTQEAFADWLAQKSSNIAVENRLVGLDGRVHHMLWTTSPHYNQAGDMVLVNGIARDITERKALEEQARLLEKRESLAIMAGGVAHDFNNLLQSVLGNADLALLDTPPGSPVAESLREVQSAAQRAAELSHKMLAYSGHTPYIPRSLDLSQMVRDMLPLLRSSPPPKVNLEYDLPAGLPAVEGDQAQLRQALRNLVINSSEALGEQPGIISITTGVMFCDSELLAGTYLPQDLTPGDYVYLRVDDSGPGMDPQNFGKAFDPFYSTKFAGRGLGLAVVLGVVKSHRGAVKLETGPAGGTRITLYLPAGQARPGPTPV